MDPSKKLRAGWGIAQGAVTIICIIIGGTSVLSILQTTSIVAAFPYMIIMIFMCVSIYKTLSKDAVDEGLMQGKRKSK
jgi:choline/glycine/proline betaine transport protein